MILKDEEKRDRLERLNESGRSQVYQYTTIRMKDEKKVKTERSQTRTKQELQEENESVNKDKPVCWERKETCPDSDPDLLYTPRIRANRGCSIPTSS